ncbi:hypothetical protein [Sinorhizobium meliloti]|uniref:phage tail tube protein n=1 Tax=Rhizobium meliloti TaxID=382 RepID=UPI0001E4A632|nr:hypothetical protein [Sinorhizobium meliloti]AEG53114.1 hypothetical protein Sinme_1367 [Sinorhizobium meliloti AK83]MDE4591172.1 hypothetical protein [Sinorhizobium meliloti]SEI55476.1 hypothetical protein SAMN04244575_01015 [Sinorhizobium meliloti]
MGSEAYTLGRGEVHFSRFRPGTQLGEGYRYLGNSPEFSLTLESEELAHFNSDRGIREKDKSITIEVSRSGNLVLDEITMENLAYFFFSAAGKQVVAEAGGAVVGYAINDVVLGRSYQLGESDSNPVGDVKISATGLSVKAGATVYVLGTDYVADLERGLITILEDGAIAAGSDLTVDYTTLATSYDLILSGSEKVEGAMKFITRNASGEDRVYTLPYITLAPNGDYNLKGDDWQQIPFTVEVLRKGALEAIYLNGLPYTPAP